MPRVGNERAGKKIAGQHGKDHRQREWTENVCRCPGQQKDWEEDNADGDRGNKLRKGDFARPVDDRGPHILARGNLTLDVLDFDERVVDENADRESEPAEGHEIKGRAGELQIRSPSRAEPKESM